MPFWETMLFFCFVFFFFLEKLVLCEKYMLAEFEKLIQDSKMSLFYSGMFTENLLQFFVDLWGSEVIYLTKHRV